MLRNTCLGTEATSAGVLGCDFGEYLTAFGGTGTVWDNITDSRHADEVSQTTSFLRRKFRRRQLTF